MSLIGPFSLFLRLSGTGRWLLTIGAEKCAVELRCFSYPDLLNVCPTSFIREDVCHACPTFCLSRAINNSDYQVTSSHPSISSTIPWWITDWVMTGKISVIKNSNSLCSQRCWHGDKAPFAHRQPCLLPGYISSRQDGASWLYSCSMWLHMLSQQDLLAPTTPLAGIWKHAAFWHRNEPAVPRGHKDEILAKEGTMRTELRLWLHKCLSSVCIWCLDNKVTSLLQKPKAG